MCRIRYSAHSVGYFAHYIHYNIMPVHGHGGISALPDRRHDLLFLEFLS